MVSVIAALLAYLLALIGCYRLTYWLSAQSNDEKRAEAHEIAVDRLVAAASRAVPLIGYPGIHEEETKDELKQAIKEVTGEHWSDAYRD